MRTNKELDNLCVATIRSLCIDGINKSNSGHPGIALGAAPILYTLYNYFLNSNPKHPEWRNRDRFILSAGHASMLQYAILHVCGFKVSMDDLKNFRQINSRTPGHPEIGVTPGIDTSSGPLGQGIAEAVGFAMAEEKLRNMYGSDVYNHYTYAMCGDGCLEEGISQEAITYAGFQKLNKLILLYDSNGVTLDGPLAQSTNDSAKLRFKSAGWNVLEVKDGNDCHEIAKAINKAKKSEEKPTLIIVNTIIGFGSKNQGLSKTHGAPLGVEDGKNAKLSYGFDHEDFYVPNEVYTYIKKHFVKRGKKAYKEYMLLNKDKIINDGLTLPLNNEVMDFSALKEDSTRKGSQKVLNFYHRYLSTLIGGCADVAGSVMTSLENSSNFTSENRGGDNINWGIREFLMSAASNGILLHGGLRTYCGCFAVFADYLKPALRMAALMGLPQIFLFSHDSLNVGEDGPTHQPVEQLAMLRSIPNNLVFRPCDDNETFGAYEVALKTTNKPSCILLTRQNLPILSSSNHAKVANGAYVIDYEDRNKEIDYTLIATGSEVSLALATKNLLKDQLNIRVVSMPCMELFNETSEEYQAEVLGTRYCHRIVIEMGSTYGLYRYGKHVYGVDKFGASGKASDVIKAYKFQADDLAKYILSLGGCC